MHVGKKVKNKSDEIISLTDPDTTTSTRRTRQDNRLDKTRRMEMTYHKDPSGLCLRRVKIRREQNGFGFTLRHFIVYPPELYSNSSQDDERQRRNFLVKVTEPVDTIFVRSVVQNGPADKAGLCVGDRIVSVNGRTVFGTSYDAVVQLILKSPEIVCLEVSPKQYDTLQLFFEETAYRPETNQRPHTKSTSIKSNLPFLDQYGSCYLNNNHYDPDPRYHSRQPIYYEPHDPTYGLPPIQNYASEPQFLSNHYSLNQGGSMSSSQRNNTSGSSSSNAHFLSHLPRPTPYKSPAAWSNTTPRNPLSSSSSAKGQYQFQTYYPFNQDQLWNIKEEPKGNSSNAGGKSEEGINSSTGGYDGLTSHRSGSMECLIHVPGGNQGEQPERSCSAGVTSWKTGGRYASYDEAGAKQQFLSSQRRESTGSIPNSSSSNVQSGMVVTMSSTNSRMQGSYPPELSDSGSSLAGGSTSTTTTTGYEHKMADRIRRSCEQKEEFLKRPNQPFTWAPLQSSSAGSFPKELYAQPQKFEKIPWPPAHVVPTVSTTKPPPIQSCHTNTGSLESHRAKSTSNNVSSVNVNSGRPPVDPTYSMLSQNQPPYEPRSLSPSWLEYAPKNRTVIIGSSKIHCDPPPDWNPELRQDPDTTDDATALEGAGGEVKLRVRNTDLDETERLVRRVSYLKATSSPIDMDKSNYATSPTSPTLSCGVIGTATSPVADVGVGGSSANRRRSVANKLSAEFFPKGRIIRLKQFFEEKTQQGYIFKFNVDSPTAEYRGGFGNLLRLGSPDSSEVLKEGQVHYKVRLKDKKGGYNRSWRQGWAQIRKSGCLYISKEPLSPVTEDAVILALSLRRGVTVEPAEDYTKRKHVLRIKTTYSPVDIGGESISNQPAQHHQSHSTPVEILIQAEDMNDFVLWTQCLHTQLENNNFCNNESTDNFKGIYFGPDFFPKSKSLLTSFLPSPATSQANNAATVPHPNSLQPPGTSTGGGSSSGGPQNAASPKNKTWKGKVARQWKKVHNIIEAGGDANTKSGSSPYSSIPPIGVTFGINLENCPPGENNPFIPRVIEYAVEVVERRGIEMVGLYRIPGNNASVATLTERLNKGEDPNPEKDPKWLDVHVVASLIKSFLRRLPDPLLTDDRYQAFIIAADDTDQQKCFEKMQILVNDLPDTNYETLRAVILHLKKVAQHGESNRMDARNLAIVFGPTIVRTAEENVTSMVQDMKNQCKIVEFLISHADELFRERRYKDGSSTKRFSKMEDSPYTSISEENVVASSNDELHQQSSSYSVSEALRLPSVAAVELYKSTEKPIPPPRLSSASPTIESELKASVVQAAMRKAMELSAQASKPSHSAYGLLSKTPPKGKSIDDRGFIRSYAGLNEETEQRVKKFEQETRAMLSREDRSPYASIINVGSRNSGGGGLKLVNLDYELQRARDDMENEDIYDQLADNPSSIVHHRDRGMFSVGSGQRNLSNSSISSSNSNGTVPSLTSVQRLGPMPFKLSSFPAQSLPPKPPQLHNSGSSVVGPSSMPSKSSISTSSSPSSPLRRIGSIDRFASDKESHDTTLSDEEKKIGHPPFSPKYYGGSLDSLKDTAQYNGQEGSQRNGTSKNVFTAVGDFSPRSSEGSDLVTSLSRTLDKKLEKLRSNDADKDNSVAERKTNGDDSNNVSNGGHPKETQKRTDTNEKGNNAKKNKGGKNGIKRNWRRFSMIERRVNGELCNGRGSSYHDKEYSKKPHSPREGADIFVTTVSTMPDQVSEAIPVTSTKFCRDARRRHSLSGGGDILSIAYHDKSIRYFDDPDPHAQLEDSAFAAITRAGILESHV